MKIIKDPANMQTNSRTPFRAARNTTKPHLQDWQSAGRRSPGLVPTQLFRRARKIPSGNETWRSSWSLEVRCLCCNTTAILLGDEITKRPEGLFSLYLLLIIFHPLRYHLNKMLLFCLQDQTRMHLMTS